MTAVLEPLVAVRTERGRRHRRVTVVAIVLAGLTVASFVATVLVGADGVGLTDTLKVLVGGGDTLSRFAVLELSLPPAAGAALVGLAFGVSGAIFQTAVRNPLASPDLLGITQGAGFAAVAVIVAGVSDDRLVAGAALLGGLVAAVVIWALAWRRGLHALRFVLVGVGVAAFASAGISWLLVRADIRQAQDALGWLVGTLANVSTDQLWLLLAVQVVTLPLVAVVAPRLRLLSLGDDHARALGAGPHRLRAAAIALAVVLVATATAVAGPIPFLALTAPAIARRLVGGAALGASALLGATIGVVAELIGSQLLPGDLTAPIGIVTGLAGAPYLLWLLSRSPR